MKGGHQNPTGFGGLPYRWQGRKGNLSPPLLWTPSQDTACPQHVTVEWDSTFLIATEQQFSTSAMVEAHLVSASLMQVACQASALLISFTWWASASLMVWAQRVLASLMASVVSDLFWWRAISKSETCSLWQASREDLVASSHPKALPALLVVESHPQGRCWHPVLTGREISSRVRSSDSAVRNAHLWGCLRGVHWFGKTF